MAAKQAKSTDQCLKCNINVGKKDKAVCCEFCHKWSHISCAAISESTYEDLKQGQANIHWFCDKCDCQVLQELAEVQKRQVTTEEKVDKVANEFQEVRKFFKDLSDFSTKQVAMEQIVDRVVNEIQDVKKVLSNFGDFSSKVDNLILSVTNIKEEQDKLEIKNLTKAFIKDESWADIVKSEVNNKLGGMSGELQKIEEMVVETKTHVEEVQDKESRRKNVIVYRAEESNSDNYRDRLKHDQDLVLRLIHYINNSNLNDIDNDKFNIVRLGKREEGKVRPLLIQFSEILHKNVLMENTYKLKDAEPLLKSMIVTHDLTKIERDECKKLVEEAKMRENADSSGEWLYRVRGPPGKMRIVKLRRAH